MKRRREKELQRRGDEIADYMMKLAAHQVLTQFDPKEDLNCVIDVKISFRDGEAA